MLDVTTNIVELLKNIDFPVEIEVLDFISSGNGFTKNMVDTSFLVDRDR